MSIPLQIRWLGYSLSEDAVVQVMVMVAFAEPGLAVSLSGMLISVIEALVSETPDTSKATIISTKSNTFFI